MRQELLPEQVLRLRMRSQRLHPRIDAAVGVAGLVRHLGGVQAQELSAATLAIRARSRGLTADDVRRAREDERSIVHTWVMRGTLHLVATEDVGWLLALLGPLFIARSARRYRELGIDGDVRDRAAEIIREALASQSPQTRPELAAVLANRGIPVEGQAIAHLVGYAAMRGVICFGPRRGARPTYVLLQDWVRPGPTLDAEHALAELALRYVGAYGPATVEDLASWSGLPMAQARSALRSVAERLHEVEVAGAPAWMLPQPDAPPVERAVRLLPSYDTYMLGYRRRDLAVAAPHASRVHPGGGQIKPTLVVDGRAVGVWQGTRRRGRYDGRGETSEPLDADILPPRGRRRAMWAVSGGGGGTERPEHRRTWPARPNRES